MSLATATNLRKAAVLIRSLDADTAATLLAQLSIAEAAAIRETMRSLGPLDPEEQADVAAELRRTKPVVKESAASGVEVRFSSAAATADEEQNLGASNLAKRFAFLDDAPAATLASYLAREHAQTIAVVVSHLAPARAAEVLAGLSAKRQAETMERLAAIGDTDPECLSAIERELSAWVARQPVSRRQAARSNAAVDGILAAADPATRAQILANLVVHSERLAARLAPKWSVQRAVSMPSIQNASMANGNSSKSGDRPPLDGTRFASTVAADVAMTTNRARKTSCTSKTPLFRFDDLVRLKASDLATLLRDVDAAVIVLALAGSSDDLVDRVTKQMPKRTAKLFRRQLRQLGPTRLSDVEAAQRALAEAAGRRFARPSELLAS